MNRENKRQKYEQGYYKTIHAMTALFVKFVEGW